jgi:hypothetical protein
MTHNEDMIRVYKAEIVALKNQIEFLQIQLESKDLANKELSKF